MLTNHMSSGAKFAKKYYMIWNIEWGSAKKLSFEQGESRDFEPINKFIDFSYSRNLELRGTFKVRGFEIYQI